MPLLIYANKQDLINAVTAPEISAGLNLHGIRDRAWEIVGCSAKSKEGLEEGMQFLISQIKS